MANSSILNLDKLKESFVAMYDSAMEFAPKIIIGLILLLIGWVIARFVQRILKKLFQRIRLEKLSEKLELDKALNRLNPDWTLSGMIAKLFYYLIMIVFLISISDVLGLDSMKNAIVGFLGRVPVFVVALIIFVLGMYVAKIIQKTVYTATNSIGVSGAKVIGSIVFYLIMIFVSLTALEQTGMNTDLISNNITLILGAILLAFALSYGLASRNIVRNFLSSYYGKGKYEEGQRIRVLDVEGVIVKIDSISVSIQTDEAIVVFPSKELLENKVEILNK